MDINDIKNAINKYSEEELSSLDIVLNGHYYDEEIFQKFDYRIMKRLTHEEYRWYTLETNVYEFTEKDGKVIGYLAIEEVGKLKSKSMDMIYCGVKVNAYNVKTIMEPTYQVIYDK